MGPSGLARLLTYLVRMAGPHSQWEMYLCAGQGEPWDRSWGGRQSCQPSLCHTLACRYLSFPSQPLAHTRQAARGARRRVGAQ